MFFDTMPCPSGGSWGRNREFGDAKNVSSPLGLELINVTGNILPELYAR